MNGPILFLRVKIFPRDFSIIDGKASSLRVWPVGAVSNTTMLKSIVLTNLPREMKGLYYKRRYWWWTVPRNCLCCSGDCGWAAQLLHDSVCCSCTGIRREAQHRVYAAALCFLFCLFSCSRDECLFSVQGVPAATVFIQAVDPGCITSL